MKSPKRPAWTSSVVSGLRRLFAPLAGSGRSLFGVAAVLLLLVIGGYIGWAKWGGQISSQRRYSLSAESFEITPQPPWIHSDIKADVVRDGSLADLSILDPDLTKRVVQAFELNTWVAEALWAGKRSGQDNSASGGQIAVSRAGDHGPNARPALEGRLLLAGRHRGRLSTAG